MMSSEDLVYPVPQNAPHVSAGMNPDPRLSEDRKNQGSRIFRIGVNVLNFPEGQRPKATDVSPWYGVYFISLENRFCNPC